jgi:parallel beta-helix repeat protein
VASVPLQGGTNTITVTARDAAGNVTSDSLTVSYAAQDTTPPTISGTVPASSATGVATGSSISVTFSEPMDAASITSTTFSINGVAASVSSSGATATLTPSSQLSASTSYTVRVSGGPSGVRDSAGNALAADYVWTFSTSASAPLACAATNVRCVDDTAGATQEYASIQLAVNAAVAGDTVLVYDGNYQGFRMSRSGTSANRITVVAQGSAALINQANSSGEGVTISNASYVTVDGLRITGMSGYGIATHDASATNPMRGLIIRNNIVSNSGSTNIYLSEVADSLVENNQASGSSSSHGIYLANGGSDNTTLKGNRCSGNAKNGIHLNGDLSVGGDGLHNRIVIDGNFVFSNVGNGMDLDGIQDSLIQNNVVYGNGRNGIRAFKIDAASGPKNLRVINNTVATTTGTGWALKFSEDGGGHTIFNNILLADPSGAGSISVANANFVSDYNALTGRLSYDGENSILGLPGWQSAAYDLHSFTATATAEFVDVAGNNFRLKTTATSINRGTTTLNGTTAPGQDVTGTGRPNGAAYDLGAYEAGN